MAKLLPPLRLNLQDEHKHVRSVQRHAQVLVWGVCASMLMLCAWEFLQQQLSLHSWVLIALITLAVLLFFLRENRVATRWCSIQHSGNTPMLLLHKENSSAHHIPLEANWLAFHSVGSLAWLRVRLPATAPQTHTIFLWESMHANRIAQSSLKDWARRWHTLQGMDDKYSATQAVVNTD